MPERAPHVFGSRRRLVYFLIAKSIAEALFVAAVALYFLFTAMPPYFKGWGEVSARGVDGWAVNEAEPWERVEVYLYIDERFAANRVADSSRPDVKAAGRAKDEWHGYHFDLPALADGEHVARIYAMRASGGGGRRTLQLLGHALRFRVERGEAKSVSETVPIEGAKE